MKLTDKELLWVLAMFPNGVSMDDILLKAPGLSVRTLQRRLAKLSEQRKITISGKARARVYQLVVHNEPVAVAVEAAAAKPEVTKSLIPLSAAGVHVRAMVTAPIQQGKPVGIDPRPLNLTNSFLFTSCSNYLFNNLILIPVLTITPSSGP